MSSSGGPPPRYHQQHRPGDGYRRGDDGHGPYPGRYPPAQPQSYRPPPHRAEPPYPHRHPMHQPPPPPPPSDHYPPPPQQQQHYPPHHDGRYGRDRDGYSQPRYPPGGRHPMDDRVDAERRRAAEHRHFDYPPPEPDFRTDSHRGPARHPPPPHHHQQQQQHHPHHLPPRAPWESGHRQWHPHDKQPSDSSPYSSSPSSSSPSLSHSLSLSSGSSPASSQAATQAAAEKVAPFRYLNDPLVVHMTKGMAALKEQEDRLRDRVFRAECAVLRCESDVRAARRDIDISEHIIERIHRQAADIN